MKRGFLNNQPPVQLAPEALDGESGKIGCRGFMERMTGGFTVLLAKLPDGGGTRQRVDDLIVVNRQGGIEVREVIVDVPRHLQVGVVKRERFATKQTVAKFRKAALRTMGGDPVRKAGHPKGLGHRLVRQ